MNAIKNDHLEIVEYLIANGADLNVVEILLKILLDLR
ncbi:ankyrin repeat domain-containing protein [Halanaerobium sp. ST460_2HS_T2]